MTLLRAQTGGAEVNAEGFREFASWMVGMLAEQAKGLDDAEAAEVLKEASQKLQSPFAPRERGKIRKIKVRGT